MKMFVANCTNQVQQFSYMVPEARSPRTQNIPIGGQVQLSGNVTTEDVNAIVEQHALYGMIAASSVATTYKHTHLLYALDKPVTRAQMLQALERNLELMHLRGAELRKEAAVAVNNMAQEENPTDFRSVALAIVEQGNSKTINEEIVVRHPGAGDAPPPKRRARRAA